MSQVIESVEQTAPPMNASAASIGVGYVVLALLPIVLKLLGLTRVANWPWDKVTATIWGPWLLVGVISIIGWIVYWVQTRRGRA